MNCLASQHTLLKVFLLAVMSVGLAACQAPNTTTETATTANTNAANTQPSTPAATNAPTLSTADYERMAQMSPVTLPVIDALFYNDEKFEADLKSQVGLSDEQIAKLKEAARNRAAQLDESDDGGSTVGARQLALQTLRETVGEDKANQVVNFVVARMNNAGEMTAANSDASGTNTANGVPTDTRIVVNAPAYRMDLFKDGQLVKSYKIGIGYPEFPLPQGLRRAETLIYNPTWTPPDEPWVRASKNIKPYQKVDAGSSLNPLGPIKIPIGLPSLIHGGKQAAKLGGFASHGCVGLTNPQVEAFARDLAEITGTELTDERIKQIQADKKKTENIKLAAALPVELRYDTIVVEDGKLKIYRDVYERGTNTEENVRRVLEGFGVSYDSLSEPEKTRIAQALKQMSRDAQGNTVDATNANSTDANANTTNKNSNNSNSKVTRTIRGAKEVVIPIAALAGKGYPAPVDLDIGAGKRAKTTNKQVANANTNAANGNSNTNNAANRNANDRRGR